MSTTLPALTGRSHELAEAAIARDEILVRLAEEITAQAGSAPADALASLIDLYREVALRQTDAGWWIDHTHRKIGLAIQRTFTADDKARLTQLAAKRNA